MLEVYLNTETSHQRPTLVISMASPEDEFAGTLRKVLPDHGFTPAYWETSQDNSLDPFALGVHTRLMSLPPNWKISADRLAQGWDCPGAGRDAIRKAFTRLERAGYMERVRSRDEKGQITTEITVRALPKPQVRPTTESQASVNQASVNQASKKRRDRREDLEKDQKPKPTHQRSYGSVGAREGAVVVGASQVQDQPRNPKPAPMESEASRLVGSLPGVFRLSPGSKTHRDVEKAISDLLGSGVWDFDSLLEHLGQPVGPEVEKPVGVLRWRVQQAAEVKPKPVERYRYDDGFEFPWCGFCFSPSDRREALDDGSEVACACASEFVDRVEKGRVRDAARTWSRRSEKPVDGSGVVGVIPQGSGGSEGLSGGSVVGVRMGLGGFDEFRAALPHRTS